MLLYATTIFLSAFLLFQVQPLIAKIILPWFGGSAAVWTAAMLFFQTSLLAGYAYAHLLIGRFNAKRQVLIHGALLAVSVALLPILPIPMWKPTASRRSHHADSAGAGGYHRASLFPVCLRPARCCKPGTCAGPAGARCPTACSHFQTSAPCWG